MAADSTASENQGRAASTARCECPRCGYDVSGVISTWKESCPVRGRCSECGLEFEWRNVFGSGNEAPKWLVESGQGSFMWRCIRTGSTALIPRVFWKRIRVWHTVHLDRLLIWCAVWSTGAYSIATLAAATYAYLNQFTPVRPPMPSTPRIGDYVMCWSNAIQGFASPFGRGVFNEAHWMVLLALWWSFTPLAVLPLSDTMREARVRPIHLMRVGAYCFAGVSILFIAAYVGRVVERFGIGIFSSRSLRRAGPAGEFARLALETSWPLVPLTGIWLFIFWFTAARAYLCFRHPRAVAASAVVIAGLLAILALTAIDPSWVMSEEIDRLSRMLNRLW